MVHGSAMTPAGRLGLVRLSEEVQAVEALRSRNLARTHDVLIAIAAA